MTKKAFFIQIIGVMIVWILMSAYYFSGSVRQDESGDIAISKRLRFFAGPGLIVFAVTISLAAFNLLMAVDPRWFSTIFGVYYFAGTAMCFFAFLALSMMWLQRNGILVNAITTEHYHDVGKLCFTFVVFWAYIAFSQYMLIWYAALPEETYWYQIFHNPGPGEQGWMAVGWGLVLGHFFVPFLFLMSRHIKRRGLTLALGCGWAMLMHWFDLFFLVIPRVEWAGAVLPAVGSLAVMTLALTGGLFALFVAAVAFVLRRCSLVPEKDPRLPESLVFENH